MKRWAIITVLLYLALVLSLTVPVFLVYFAFDKTTQPVVETITMFREWGYWLWIGISVVSQILLLAVPVALAERRPRSRRQLLVPVITAAFLFAFVCVSAVAALVAGIWGDHDKMFALLGEQGNRQIWALFIYLLVAWTVWAVVFRRFLAAADTEALIRRLMRWLLRGSILELLVAVPSHVAARHRQDCCAPAVSFWGIVTGLTVMLLSFGPGVLFLFVERVRRLQPKDRPENQA